METTAITVPETKEIEKKSSDALTSAGELEVKDDASYRFAGAFCQSLKDLMAEVDETFDDAIEAAHKTHKKILSAKKAHKQPLEDADRIVRFKMSRFFEEQQRKIREEQARIDAENRRIQEEHQRAVAKHDAEVKAEAARRAKQEADEARARQAAIEANKPAPTPAPAPVVAPPPPPPAPVLAKPVTAAPVASGVSMRTDWKHEVVSLMDLVNAVAQGLAPLNLIQANESELKAIAVRMKDKAEVPGVHFYAESVPVVR